jgi:hypothetical protein
MRFQDLDPVYGRLIHCSCAASSASAIWFTCAEWTTYRLL